VGHYSFTFKLVFDCRLSRGQGHMCLGLVDGFPVRIDQRKSFCRQARAFDLRAWLTVRVLSFYSLRTQSLKATLFHEVF
jgi:hypothetical protein